MPGNGFRIALVQAQQVTPDRSIQITGLDLVGQIGLVGTRRAAIGPTDPTLTAPTPRRSGVATARESRTAVAALHRTHPVPARPVAPAVRPIGRTAPTETTLLAPTLRPTTPTEPAVVRTAPAVRTPGAAIVPASIRVTE
jgi:hypothetical protein